jgi:transposase-like protein
LTEDHLRELYVERHLSLRAIAREVGCSDFAVRAAVRRLGLERPATGPAPGMDSSLVAELVRLYTDEGLDLRAVSARTGISVSRVSSELHEAGVRLRKRGSRPAAFLDPQALRADYEAGASLRTLAERERCDDGAIREALLRAGAELRQSGGRQRFGPILSREYLTQEYIEAGRTVGQIAYAVGCSYDTVAQAMRLHGIAARNSGGRR